MPWGEKLYDTIWRQERPGSSWGRHELQQICGRIQTSCCEKRSLRWRGLRWIPAAHLVAECWGQRQWRCHVLRAGAILSHSPVVHGYKSHHQLSEHPQPASSPPDWWRNGGEKKINGFLSFSMERATSVLFSSLMSSRSAVGNWKRSLNKLTDANGKMSLVSIQRLVSICHLFPVEVIGSALEKAPFEEDGSGLLEFLFDDSRLSKGRTGF